MQKTIYREEYGKLLLWLKGKQIDSGITMRQRAEQLDVHHSWMGRVEPGERRLDIMEYIRFCKALNADPCEGIHLLHDPRHTL